MEIMIVLMQMTNEIAQGRVHHHNLNVNQQAHAYLKVKILKNLEN